MNLIQFLAMKLHQGPFIDGMLNSTDFVDEFREGRRKSFVETIAAVCQLILQDRDVTYREIETTVGISGTSIHSIFHEHLTVKKICSRWIPHNLSIAQKKARVDWSKEIRKTNRSHTSAQTTAFLSTKNIDLMSHPPYSPVLVPNDFFLFS